MENKHQMTDISIQVTIHWLLTANCEEAFLGSPSLLSVTQWCFSFTHSIENEWTSGYLLQRPYWHRIPFFPPIYRSGAGSDGSSAVCLHSLRHGVAEGLLEAAAGRSTALCWERAHWTGAGCQWVRWLEPQLYTLKQFLWRVAVFCLPLMTGVSCIFFQAWRLRQDHWEYRLNE